jgi:hypothetical protein
MKMMKRILLQWMMLAIFGLFVMGPSGAIASDADILKRLEKMEAEINNLKKENAELRQKVDADDKEKASESAQIKKMVETDRQEIEELKKSAGRLATPGLRTVLGKYDMQLYGRVKFDVNYDTSEFTKYNDFIGLVKAGDAENDSTNFNPRDTRFGIKVAGRDGVWLSEARMETDFYGTNSGNNLIPRLRLGYVKLTNDDWNASLLLGQDWIPIASLNPPMIEFGVMAASGNLWWRVPQITLRKTIGNFELLLSAMKHRRISTAEEDRMPWSLAKISYKNGILGKGGLLAVGGGWRSESLSDNSNGLNNDVDRWLLALELKLQFGKFTFMAEPWIGDGLDEEWLRYDMGINTHDNRFRDRNRRPDIIFSRGGWASLTYAMNSKVKMSLGYGLDDPVNDDVEGIDLNDRQFTKSETYFLNTWYSLTNAVKVGLEIQYKETERFSDTNNGMRFTWSTAYLF